MTYKTSEIVMRISLLIFLLLLGITCWLKMPVFAGIGMVAAIAGISQTFIYHRCPKCEEFINPFLNGKLCSERIVL